MQHCTTLRLDNRFLDAGDLSLVIPLLYGDKERHFSWASRNTTEYENAMQKFVDDLVQVRKERHKMRKTFEDNASRVKLEGSAKPSFGADLPETGFEH